MIRNIIVPCDGTWNGVSTMTRTNVARLAEIIENLVPVNNNIINVVPPGGSFQGVGIGRGLTEFVINGALAQDLDDKVKEAYTFIANSYDSTQNNYVWLFGFSRGAYTVRSVAGMINNCGIVNVAGKSADFAKRLIDNAYDIYRKRGHESSPHGPAAEQFRNSFSHPNSDAAIKFMGLWDTVGAHGLPSYEIGTGFKYLEFYDQIVSSSINYVYQAIAVHEDLAFFEPCHVFSSGRGGIVAEEYFPGVHIDIGGFVQDNPVSDATLEWMVEKINSVTINGTDEPAIGALIPPQTISAYPPGLIVQIARWALKAVNIFRLVIRDRVIIAPMHDPLSVLYNRGNWINIARSGDYSSQAYNHFLEWLDFRSIGRPPPF